jgi:PGAP1-like protein
VAARFWQGVLGAEIVLAALLDLLARAVFSLSAAAALALLPVVLALSPWIVAGLALALWRPHDQRSSLPGAGAVRRFTPFRGLFSLEPAHLTAAALAMSWDGLSHRASGAPQSGAAARPVLLIHGLLCNGALWGPLCKRLARSGWGPMRAVTLEPLMADIESHARRIAHELVALQNRCGGERVTIITHSMGGLIARAALRAAGSNAVRRVVTIACPHHGTLFASRLELGPLRQMRPASLWLQALNAVQEGRFSVPVTSLYSLDDALIVPARSAALAGARSRELRGLGHFGLLRARGSAERILEALATE